MALPKIGLEAVLEDDDFRKGLKNYIDGIDKMEKGNKEMSEAAKKSGKSLDGLSDDMRKTGISALDLHSQMQNVKDAMNIVKDLAGKGLELAKLGATAERVEERFEAFAEEAGGATAMLEAFQVGAGGAASEMDAMLASSKLLQMGLVTNAEEMETTVELATRLGDQTASVTSRVEDFALMLANQSIPRLDNFGISSGQVRARITELMGSVEGMTRETAFMQATMEAGGESLAILGERTKDTAMTFEIMEARMADAKVELGKKFAPVAGAVFEILGGLGDEVLMVGAAFGEFGSALVQAGPLLNAMIPMFGKMPGLLKKMNVGLGGSVLSVGALAAAFIALKIVVDKYNKSMEAMKQAEVLAVEAATKSKNAILEQIDAGQRLGDVMLSQADKTNVATKAWNDNIITGTALSVLVGAQNKILEIYAQKQQAVTEAVLASTTSYDEYITAILIYNDQLTDAAARVDILTQAEYENTQVVQDAKLATLLFDNEIFFLTQEMQNQADAVENVDAKMFAYAQSMRDGTILTDENAIAQANLVYELGLQEQAHEDAKQAIEDSNTAAEEAARVQEELAIAHQKVIDTIIIEQQQYLTLAERMKGIDEAGQMRMVLDQINRLQREGIDIGEPYWQAQQRIQDQMGVTTPKSRFMAEGFHMITEAAEEGRLGNWTYAGAVEALFGSWDKGAKNALTWAESIGLAPPLADSATGAVDLYGEAVDGVSQPSLDAASSAAIFGTKADELYKAVVPVTEQTAVLAEKIERMATATGEAEEPIQRTEQATRILQKELRGTLDPTDALTGAVELYGEAGDLSTGPVEALTEKTKELTTAAGESVGPLGDAETAVDDFAESTLEAQDPVDELLARFELLPDQILTLAPQMRQAGVSLVGAFRVGFEGAFDALEEEKVKRLRIFREEFHASREPKDPTSPLRGFYEAGAALVQTYMEGLESEWPNLGKTLDDMFSFGRVFGGLGGIAGGIINKNIRGMKEATKGIDAELTKIFKSLGVEGRPKGAEETYQAIIAAMGGQRGYLRLIGAEVRGEQLTKDQARRLAIFKSLMPLMRERGELTREQVRLEEKLQAMQEQQTRLRFLEQQVALLELIEKHGLMGEDILDGMKFGADASAEEVLDAMTRAMQEVIRQAEERLGIESPSKVFFKIGQQTMAGMALGIRDLATLPVRQSLIASGAVASAPAMTGGGYVDNSRTVTIQAGGNTITNAAEGAHFESRVKRAVVKGMRGL